MRKKKPEKAIQLPSTEEYKAGHVSYEYHQEHVDSETGELISSTHGFNRQQDNEPNYIKLYLNTMMAFQGIEGVSTELLLCLCNHIDGYNNSENEPLIFKNDVYNRRMMAKELGIKDDMIYKHIKKLVDTGILVKTNMRAVYYVNPWLIARGKWKHIQKLQCHFDIFQGQWKVDATLNPQIEEE